METLYMSSWYARVEQEPTCDNTHMSEDLIEHLTDENDNGVPDYIDALLEWEWIEEYWEEQLDLLDLDADLDGLPDREDDSPEQNSEGTSFIDGLWELDEKAAAASEQIDTIIEGLGCWFGWGGCIANPLNWAPLAPWNDPTLFGMPAGDGLNIDEWIPIFSALTGLVTPIGCIPFIWPLSPLDYSAWCSWRGAWGYLWVENSYNFIRIYVTPTLTWAWWVAICFWWPASKFWKLNPKRVHPIVPGGNCIVAAAPLPLCSNDGSDGDPSYIGRPEATANSDYSVIGWNCELADTTTETINPALIEAYLASGGGNSSFVESIKAAVENGEIASWEYWINSNPTPLIQGGEWDPSIDVGFSVSGEDGFVFQDVQNISMRKINPFPDFVAWWWERQIWEIADKLTDFPWIYVILPDFSWFIQWWWENFGGWLKGQFDKGVKLYEEDQAQVNTSISTLEKDYSDIGCESPETRTLRCSLIETRISKLKRDNGIIGGVPSGVKAVQQKWGWYMSWVKLAYEFLSSLPLVSIEPQKVNVTVPWADEATLRKTITEWKYAKTQWENELQSSPFNDAEFNSWANRLLSSLDKNIDIIEHYLRFPTELNKLLRAKEMYLEQITCNIDVINETVNGRIDRNGKRFKAWVELYITIKAILKSWQLMVDIFYEYEAECHECKNERQDLYYYAFNLISLVIPEIPVIQFPRMPDVVIDLHNIRAGITIGLPEIEVTPRPIVLPPLPRLSLPDAPDVSVTLPELPLLDDYSIPELPELPSLPFVELPDLPPPPTLPKIFSEIEGMISILKLITKVMCILKSSPFVPEWRAGDQIAFITERTWYLPSDFKDVSLSSPSYSFVDQIKVSSYVNLEYETDFIVEATRSALLPFNSFTTEVSKKINRRAPDFNLENVFDIPDNVNIDEEGIDAQWYLDSDAEFRDIIVFVVQGITSLISYMDKNAADEVESKYFTKLANESLNQKWIIQDPRYNELRNVWQSVQEYDYIQEEEFIDLLKARNAEKFDTVLDIIKREEILHKKQEKEIETLWHTPLSFASEWILISDTNYDRFSQYQTQLDPYNDYSSNSFVSLIETGNPQQKELEAIAENLLNSMQKGADTHNYLLSLTDEKTLFADHNSSHASVGATGGTCEASHANDINYKGIYILEQGTPYRLFDYLDEIDWDEEHRYFDYDNDGDQDITYMMNGVIYLKENLEETSNDRYISSVNTTNFSEMDEKFEAINGFREVVENGFVNITFNAHTNREVNGYRLEYYDRIDAFDADESENPDDYKKVTVDAFARIDELTVTNESESYIVRDNIWRVINPPIGRWIEVEVDELVNIGTILEREGNTIVQIWKWTKIYSGNTEGRIYYYYKSDDTDPPVISEYILAPHSNIEFIENIIVVGPSRNIYTKSRIRKTYTGWGAIDMVRLPLLENTIVRYEDDGTILNNASILTIEYYEGTEARIDLLGLKKYELLDLWPEQEEYFIKTSMENAFYYGRFSPFLDNEFWTAVSTVLMSPQNEIDSTPPELDYSGFRIPVYQERTFDLTPYLYEDDGIRWIAEMHVDIDTLVDSDGNGNPSDDRDISVVWNGDAFMEWITLEKSLTFVRLRFDAFDELIQKRIKVIMIDVNDNVWEKILDVEVYAPVPDVSYWDQGQVRWKLRENIWWEPISLFRYRWWVLSRLRDIWGAERIVTWFNGDFQFNFPVENAEENDLTISDTESDNDIATVNWDTGQIIPVAPLTTVNVYASNDINNPSLDLDGNPISNVTFEVTQNGDSTYIQSIDIPGWYNQLVTNFDDVSVEWIYVSVADLDSSIYWVTQIPDNAEFSPWAIIIYYLDTPWEALFTIQRDGNISVKDENYVLSYGTYEDYIVLSLVDLLEEKVAWEVLINWWEDFRIQ
jgi:hypothetical protein